MPLLYSHKEQPMPLLDLLMDKRTIFNHNDVMDFRLVHNLTHPPYLF